MKKTTNTLSEHYLNTFKRDVMMNQTNIIQKSCLGYYELCKKILCLNPKLKFVGIISNKGRLITTSLNDKSNFPIDDKYREMLFMEVALRTKMLGDFNSYLEEINFSVHNTNSRIIMEFPVENETIFVSTEKEINLNYIPNKITEVLKNITSFLVL